MLQRRCTPTAFRLSPSEPGNQSTNFRHSHSMSEDSRIALLSPPETPCMSQTSSEHDTYWRGTQFSTLQQPFVSSVSSEQVAAGQYSEHNPLAAIHCTQEFSPARIINALLSPDHNDGGRNHGYGVVNELPFPTGSFVPHHAHHTPMIDASALTNTIYNPSSASSRSNPATQVPYMRGNPATTRIDRTNTSWPQRNQQLPPTVSQETRPVTRKMRRFRLNHSQTRILLNEFAVQPHPDATHRERLAQQIPGLSARQVQVWFQNRRAKLKRSAADERGRLIATTLPAAVSTTQPEHTPHITPASNVNTTLTSPARIRHVHNLAALPSTTLDILLPRYPVADTEEGSLREPYPLPITTTRPHLVSPSLGFDDKPSTPTVEQHDFAHSRRQTTSEMPSSFYGLNEHYQATHGSSNIEHSTVSAERIQTPAVPQDVAALYGGSIQQHGHTASEGEPWSGMPVLGVPQHQSPIDRYSRFSDSRPSPSRLNGPTNDAPPVPTQQYPRYPNMVYDGGLEEQYAREMAHMAQSMSRNASLEAAQHQVMPYQPHVFGSDPGMQTQQHTHPLEDSTSEAHVFDRQTHSNIMAQSHGYWSGVSRA